MMKQIEFKSTDIPCFYDPIYDIVYINSVYKQTPKLYQFVKEHELNHARHRFEYWYHLKLDLKDGIRYYSDEFKEERKALEKFKNDRFKKYWKYWFFILFYNSIFQIILTIYILFNELYKILKRGMKEVE